MNYNVLHVMLPSNFDLREQYNNCQRHKKENIRILSKSRYINTINDYNNLIAQFQKLYEFFDYII